MEPRMIGGITSKGQGNPPGTIAGDRKVETGSPLTGDPITDCSPAYLKVQRDSFHKKVDRASSRPPRMLGVGDHRNVQVLATFTKDMDTTLRITTTKVADRRKLLEVRKLTQGTVHLKAPPSKEGKSHSPSNEGYQLLSTSRHKSQDLWKRVPLVGFSGGKPRAIREVLLEITIGDTPLSRSKTLIFVIIRSNSPYNVLLGRTAMQKMGMLSIASTPNRQSHRKTASREHFKERLPSLLRTNADVFAWTYADMMGIPRTITIDEKPFNTEHKLNEYSHIKPIKQKRGILGPWGNGNIRMKMTKNGDNKNGPKQSYEMGKKL
ncbi:hypothetical protein Tco_0999731 [Tanacetum coccineum]